MRAEVHVQYRQKIKKRKGVYENIFAQSYIWNPFAVEKTQKNTYRFYAKGYILVELKNTNTLHNTENPLHLKLAAQPHLKAEVQVYDHMLGPKIKQHKKQAVQP